MPHHKALNLKKVGCFFYPQNQKQGGHTHAKLPTHHPAGASIGERKKLLAERERNETKPTYCKHKQKAIEHEEKGLERKARNHRIFTRGGMLESFLIKPLLLSDDEVHILLKIIFHKPDVGKLLNKMLVNAEKRITDDEEKRP